MGSFMHITTLSRRQDEDGEGLSPQEAVEWIDLDLEKPESIAWLQDASGLDDQVRALLMQPSHTNRHLQFKDATYVGIRVLDVTPAAKANNYITLELWLEPRRVITARRQQIDAIHELERERRDGGGPGTPWSFLAFVARRLTDQLEDCVTGLGAEVDVLEDQVLQQGRKLPIDESAAAGRRLLAVRRYIAPLVELLNFISTDPVLKISQYDRAALREAADHVAYYVRNTDLALDRARLMQQQIQSRLAARMDQATYKLSLVATVFLPLAFVTGLLGINVAGIPGSHDPYAFWVVCLFLVALAGGSMIMLHRRDRS